MSDSIPGPPLNSRRFPTHFCSSDAYSIGMGVEPSSDSSESG